MGERLAVAVLGLLRAELEAMDFMIKVVCGHRVVVGRSHFDWPGDAGASLGSVLV